MAALGRLTSEAFLLIDRSYFAPLTAAQGGRRAMRGLLALAERACEEARRMGIDSCHAWLAPEIAARFGPQIARMGWARHDWPTYVKFV